MEVNQYEEGFDMGVFNSQPMSNATNVKKPAVQPRTVDHEPALMAAEDIESYIQKQKAKSTCYKDKSDLNTFTKYYKKLCGEKRDIEKIEGEQLDNILCQFFINAISTKGVSCTNQIH